MKDYKKLIAEAVKKVQGKKTLPIGSVAAHADDPITRELIAYEDEGAIAVLSWGGITKRWPANEVFDPNDALQEAMDLQIESANAAVQSAPQN